MVIAALTHAYRQRHPKPGLLFHSDQDRLYSSLRFQYHLKTFGMIASMSRKKNCWDNACAESFFASLKNELMNGRRFVTRDEAITAVFEWIEVFYNRVRRHSTLGYQSPVDFERRTRQLTHAVHQNG